MPFLWKTRPTKLSALFDDIHLPETYQPESLVEYFKLCLLSHHISVASFLPTDVDLHIRFKLWKEAKEKSQVLAMAQMVVDSYDWLETAITTRVVEVPQVLENSSGNRKLSGHHGEWFSTALAAYGALSQPKLKDVEHQKELLESLEALISLEVKREAQFFKFFHEAGDDLGLVNCATLVAHNFGDLDRVLEAWNLHHKYKESKFLSEIYQATQLGKDAKLPMKGSDRFWLLGAGQLNTALMAVENHRHYCLRAPRMLRDFESLLLPLGPFFDEWGERVVREFKQSFDPFEFSRAMGEVLSALVSGWEILWKSKTGPLGYARALRGISLALPGGVHAIEDFVPARFKKVLRAGPLHSTMQIRQDVFEQRWFSKSNQFMKQWLVTYGK